MKYTLTMSALVALGAAQKFHLERRVSSAPQVNGYAASASIDGSALAVPVDCTGYDTFMGSLYFSGDPFDPSLCAEACTAQSQLNQIFPPADGPVQTCQFFNTYQLLRNGLLEWQVCSMYSMSWDATLTPKYTGEWEGQDQLTIGESLTYTNSTNGGAPRIPCPVAAASSVIATSTLQPYCSTLLAYTTPVVTSTSSVTVTVPSTTVRSTYTRVSTITSVVTSTLRITTPGQAPTILPRGPVVNHIPEITSTPVQRRDGGDSIPGALAPFPSDVVSSACSLLATPVPSTITSTATTTSTSTVTDGQSTVVITANYISTTRTTVTSTTTTFVPPDPTNTMWVSPGLSDAGKYIKSCYKGVSGGGLCQSNFAPDGREGFLVTSDHYLYSTTYGTYISGNIAALYNDRTSIGFGSTTDKSKAAAIFYATPNGDGTSQVHLKDFSRNTEFYFCYYNQYVAPYSGDFNIGWSVVGYNPNNGGRGSWCIPTVLTLHD